MSGSPSEKKPLLLDSSVSGSAPFVLVIHGGAGTMSKEGSTPEQRQAYRNALCIALQKGFDVLHNGGEAMDAVVAAVASMEDDPLFNSGKGAVFNTVGKNELEASIMLSKPPASHPHVPSNRRGLGLTLLTRARNPSRLVRSLYLHPGLAPHTFLSGVTAESIGESLGETLVDPSYFFTRRRWLEHRRGLGLPDEPYPLHSEPQVDLFPRLDQLPKGTVGAVALDIRGCIAVSTSTGGRTNKLAGRIGDTPSMGAGYWAEEWKQPGRCRKLWSKMLRRPLPTAIGVSGTGDGDYFIRQSTCSTIAHRVQYLHETLDEAATRAIETLLKEGGIGGVIAVDNLGNISMPLNCPGMYRGVIGIDGMPKTAIFADDPLE